MASDKKWLVVTKRKRKVGRKRRASTVAGAIKKRSFGYYGVKANECIKIYLVSSKEEVVSGGGVQIEPVGLNNFFAEDGKIYGYLGLKITIWISTMSFHAHAAISFESKSDRGKGITNLKVALKHIFAENFVERRGDFLETFMSERDFVKSIVANAEILPRNALAPNESNGNPNGSKAMPSDVEVQVVRVGTPVGHIYCRLRPLLYLLIDGIKPIKSITEVCILVQKVNLLEAGQHKLLAFVAIERLAHNPGTLRLHQALNDFVAISPDIRYLTFKDPVGHLEHLRTCINVQRLRTYEPIKQELEDVVLYLMQGKLNDSQEVRLGLPRSVQKAVRRDLKMEIKQLKDCWEILVYLHLDPLREYMETFRTGLYRRIKVLMMFKPRFVFWNHDYKKVENEDEDEDGYIDQEERLNRLVDRRIRDIKLVADKICQCDTSGERM